jgi:hypothetical protein
LHMCNVLMAPKRQRLDLQFFQPISKEERKSFCNFD